MKRIRIFLSWIVTSEGFEEVMCWLIMIGAAYFLVRLLQSI